MPTKDEIAADAVRQVERNMTRNYDMMPDDRDRLTDEIAEQDRRIAELEAAAVAPLVYTRERPTVAGWYWCRDKFGDEAVCRVRIGAWTTAAFVNDEGNHIIESLDVEWAGPIPEPGA